VTKGQRASDREAVSGVGEGRKGKSNPVKNTVPLAFTRHIEHEADRFVLEITQTNHSPGTAFVKLQQDALSNPWPGPLFRLWRADHPPLGERIEFSSGYHPWREGAPLRYEARFKN
jgi:hypothetical protein